MWEFGPCALLDTLCTSPFGTLLVTAQRPLHTCLHSISVLVYRRESRQGGSWTMNREGVVKHIFMNTEFFKRVFVGGTSDCSVVCVALVRPYPPSLLHTHKT